MKIALAIPHLPDGGARTLSANALLRHLGFGPDLSDFSEAAANAGLQDVRIFKEKMPNHEWALAVWTWFASLDVDWCVQLQDDTLVADRFWPILRAQLAAAPGDVVGLATVHPNAPYLLRGGSRWFRTRAWTIGWGVAYRTRWIRDVLLPWRLKVLEHALTSNEDSFVNDCVSAHAGSVYHPIPSIVDHDVSLASTYASVDDGYRRGSCCLGAHRIPGDPPPEALEDPEFWRPRAVVPFQAFPDKKGTP